MYQMKEQNKTLDKELNKMEKSHILDAKFITLVMRMLSEFRGIMNELSENFNSIKRTRKP